jgi:error-prone DNA polymerase
MDGLPDCLALLVPSARIAQQSIEESAVWLRALFGSRAWLTYENLFTADETGYYERLRGISERVGLPQVAVGDVHMHVASAVIFRTPWPPLRHRCAISEAVCWLYPRAERHLRPLQTLVRLYPGELLTETYRIAEQCTFDLCPLKYEYPEEIVPTDETPTAYSCAHDMGRRSPTLARGNEDKLRSQIEHELALVAKLRYEGFFLTVFDIVSFAKSRGILCQGRGSAANSAVCFTLGITEVDPARGNMLFERFVSEERNEPPDIDVDFEHQRREEVIQYVYSRKA